MKFITIAILVATAQADITLTRKVTSVETGFTGTLNIDKDCTSTDQYGCAAADAKWGDSLKVTINATVPKDLTASVHMKAAIKVNNVLPFDVDCAICGTDCDLTIPIIKKKVTIKMPPCPIKAGPYGTTTVAAIPSKDPAPLKVTAAGTVTLEDTTTNAVIAAGSIDLTVAP